MLPSLFRQTITVYRKSGGYRDANDRWVEGSETPITHSRTSVQPTTARDLQFLPEGERVDGALRIFDADPLYTVDETTGTEADIVEYNGNRYRVVTVNPWLVGLLEHYEAIVVLER